MIVLDASVVVEILLGGPLAARLRQLLERGSQPWIVPHLLDVEVISALRNLAASRRIDVHRTQEFLDALASLPVERYGHTPLLERIWDLRHNFTAYDAAYIALAEATGSILCTTDEKLSKGHSARVILVKA